MAKLTREDREAEARRIRHSSEMEGFETSPQEHEIHDRWVAGDINADELHEEIKRMHGLA